MSVKPAKPSPEEADEGFAVLVGFPEELPGAFFDESLREPLPYLPGMMIRSGHCDVRSLSRLKCLSLDPAVSSLFVSKTPPKVLCEL